MNIQVEENKWDSLTSPPSGNIKNSRLETGEGPWYTPLSPLPKGSSKVGGELSLLATELTSLARGGT